MAKSKIDIFNAALRETRNREVSDNDGSIEWRTLERAWKIELDAELELGKYNWGKTFTALTNRSDGDFNYDDKYLLPTGCEFVRHVYLNDQITELWDSDDTYLYIDATSGVEIEYIRSDAVTLWKGLFARGMKQRMMAVALRGINGEHGEAAEMDAAADRTLMMARKTSSSERGKKRHTREGNIMQSRRYGSR